MRLLCWAQELTLCTEFTSAARLELRWALNEGHFPNWAAKVLNNRRPAAQLMFAERTKLTFSHSFISKPEGKKKPQNAHRSHLSSTGLFLALGR